MEQRTGRIEAIIVEIKDRERIGGAYLNSDAICCTTELSREGSCKRGEVIIQRNPANPEWPKRIATFFSRADEEANMATETIEIDRTGMYYLCFMFCEPQLQGTVIYGKPFGETQLVIFQGKWHH